MKSRKTKLWNFKNILIFFFIRITIFIFSSDTVDRKVGQVFGEDFPHDKYIMCQTIQSTFHCKNWPSVLSCPTYFETIFFCNLFIFSNLRLAE